MIPPEEDKWQELRLYDRCTCLEYDWQPYICPYACEFYDDEAECTCCPYCENNCGSDI